MNGFSIQCGMLGGTLTGAGTQVVLDGPFGTPESTWDGYIGIRFFVNTSITVTALSRWKVAGNTGTHTVKIWSDSHVQLASASVDMTTGSSGSFVSTPITPLFLASGSFYRLGSLEASGTDEWYARGGIYTFDGVIGYSPIDPSAAFGATDLSGGIVGTPGEMFGPVGFEYQ